MLEIADTQIATMTQKLAYNAGFVAVVYAPVFESSWFVCFANSTTVVLCCKHGLKFCNGYFVGAFKVCFSLILFPAFWVFCFPFMCFLFNPVRVGSTPFGSSSSGAFRIVCSSFGGSFSGRFSYPFRIGCLIFGNCFLPTSLSFFVGQRYFKSSHRRGSISVGG